MSLTTTDIKRAKPGRQVYEIHDRDGLVLRVWPTGAKTWSVRYRDGGEPRRTTVGRFPELGPENARQECRRIRNIAAGKGDMTVRGLAEDYIALWAKPNKRSWVYDRNLLDRHILEARVVPEGRRRPVRFGDRPLAQISRQEVFQVIDPIRQRGATDMAARVHACLRRMLQFAFDRGLLQGNPASRANIRQSPPRQRMLAAGEVAEWWPHVERIPPASRLALALVLGTCQRLGEVLGMAPREIDRYDNLWTIPETKTKNGRRHVVPLTPLTLALIDEARARWPDSDTVLPVSADTVRDWMARTVASARLERATPHDLRRTGVTWISEFGHPRTVQDKLVNHVDASVSGIYDLYAYMNERREALEKLAHKLEALGVSACANCCPARALSDEAKREGTPDTAHHGNHKG